MSDDPYRRGNPNQRPGQPGAQRPDDRYYQGGHGVPQDPYARDAGAPRPPSYSGYRQPYPDAGRPAGDYRQPPAPPAPPSAPFSGGGEGRPVEHHGYHDNTYQQAPRAPEPRPSYDPQNAYYQGGDVYQNQYADQPPVSQSYAPPPPPPPPAQQYAPPPPPQDYGQRDAYRQQPPAPPPPSYGSAPSAPAEDRFFLGSAPQERAPAPPPLTPAFDFPAAPPAPKSSGNLFPEDDPGDPGWSHYDNNAPLPPAAVAPSRRHDDDLDADFFADEEDFEAAHAFAQPEKKGGRLKMVLAVLAGAVLIGAGGMWGFKMLGGKRASGDAATIAADSSPLKETPSDPGGRQFANQGKKIYERLENMTDADPPGAAPAPSPSSPPSSFDDRLNQAMQGRAGDEPHPQLAQPVDPEKVRTVRTETYMPDGSRVATPPSVFPGMAVSTDTPPPAAAPRRQVVQANAVPAAAPPRPAPQQFAAAQVPASAPDADGYYLQLSSTQDQQRAGGEASFLQHKYAAVLGGVPLAVKEGVVRDKTYYRIKAGPLESKDAGLELCNKLKTAGMTTLGPCLITK